MKKLRNKLTHIPKTPGVYFLKNAGGKILYVGKARNLGIRTRSYFEPYSGFSGIRASLTNEISDIGWKETGSEVEALLLESRLIKTLRPRYNILMRDDKQYFFAGFTKEDFPRVFITHQIKPGTNQYVGPFTDGGALKKTLKILRGIFPYYISRKHSRVKCTYCHIGLCPGPNPQKIRYRKNIRHIKDILKGKRSGLLTQWKKEMKNAAKKERFEEAAELRDRVEALENIFAHSIVLSPDAIEYPSPPERASDARLDVQGLTSYMALFKKHLGITLSLKKQLRIEGYDISNIQGRYATGSMVVFSSNPRINTNTVTNSNEYLFPDRNEYRKFRIKTVRGANDVAMMKEVLERRFRHGEWPMPDLILVDGGRAQLNAALRRSGRSKESEELRIPIIALAKREEEIYVLQRKEPVRLSKNDPLLGLLMYIRDEAHRFAIGYYRKLHGKSYR